MYRSLLYILLTGLIISLGSCESRSGKRDKGGSDRNGTHSSYHSEIRDGYYAVKKL